MTAIRRKGSTVSVKGTVHRKPTKAGSKNIGGSGGILTSKVLKIKRAKK